MGIVSGYTRESVPWSAIIKPGSVDTNYNSFDTGSDSQNSNIISLYVNADFEALRFIGVANGQAIKANQSIPVVGFCYDSGVAGSSVDVHLDNQIIDFGTDVFSAANKAIFLIDPTTSGGVNFSETPNFSSSKYHSQIGYSISTQKLFFKVRYCCFIS